MITYRHHIVYVVTHGYPTNGALCDVVRAAYWHDLGVEHVGVMSNGRCIPLSPREVAEVRGRAVAK